jgi:type IV pilus assembly protein PilF
MKALIIIGCCLLLILSACSTITPESSNQKEAAGFNTKLALAYLARKDIPRAKAKMLLALQEDPYNPIILDAMGYFLEKTGNIKLAEEYYLRAIKLAPKMGRAQNNYGTYLCRHGQYHEAITHFLLAVEDANYLHAADAYENASICALKIPNKKLAHIYLRQAIQRDPGKILR